MSESEKEYCSEELTEAQSEDVKSEETVDDGTKNVEEMVTAGENACAVLEQELEALKKENADLKDQVLRRAADFDNYRKRMIKEKQDAFDYANENLLRDLLESLDNFDRTVEAASQATDAKAIADGVKMINATLVKMLEEKYNLSSYGVAGELFDPDEHEAIGSVQEAVAEPVLKEVYLKGYKLKDRIIRHAKVMVAMPNDLAKSDTQLGG